MSSDWYDDGYNFVISTIAEELGISEDIVKKVYSAISDYNLIDYDVEKEIFWEIMNDEE